MRYGHGLNETMKRWAYGMDTFSRFVRDITSMSDHSREREMTSREKEKPSRLTSNAKFRHKIRDKLLTCIAPLDPYGHRSDLANVVTDCT